VAHKTARPEAAYEKAGNEKKTTLSFQHIEADFWLDFCASIFEQPSFLNEIQKRTRLTLHLHAATPLEVAKDPA
jgi:hypothetical protein